MHYANPNYSFHCIRAWIHARKLQNAWLCITRNENWNSAKTFGLITESDLTKLMPSRAMKMDISRNKIYNFLSCYPQVICSSSRSEVEIFIENLETRMVSIPSIQGFQLRPKLTGKYTRDYQTNLIMSVILLDCKVVKKSESLLEFFFGKSSRVI